MSSRALLIFAAASLYAQDPAFEVASIKPSAGGDKRTTMTVDPGRLSYNAVPLGVLIEKAYGVRTYQVTGPDWIRFERYDLTATFPAGATAKEIPAMLRRLLIDRFHLSIHREEKTLPVYELSAAAGLKLKAADRPAESPRITMTATRRHLTGPVTMSALAIALSGFLDQPAIDATGAEGVYDVDLEWAPDEREAHSLIGMKMGMERAISGKSAPDDAGGPTLATALRNIAGIRLEPRKAALEMIVVDRAERVPVEN